MPASKVPAFTEGLTKARSCLEVFTERRSCRGTGFRAGLECRRRRLDLKGSYKICPGSSQNETEPEKSQAILNGKMGRVTCCQEPGAAERSDLWLVLGPTSFRSNI